MKVVNSLKSLKKRDRNNRVIRRKGRLYVINKRNPRMKARQGQNTPADFQTLNLNFYVLLKDAFSAKSARALALFVCYVSYS